MKLPSVLSPPRLPHRRSKAGRGLASAQRSLHPETLEERRLLAVGPQLISIQPNAGDVLSNGVVRHVAPQQLTFVFDDTQQIDGATLTGIRITRAGFDSTFDGVTDVLVAPGYSAVDPDRPNEVIVRFAETLPDDLYRVEIFGVDDPARGYVAVRNVSGDPFQPAVSGADRTTINFELDLGAQVLAVVPQPITRQPDGSLVQARNQIEVYFNEDDLDPTAATNPEFYRLIYTNETVENTDDGTAYQPGNEALRPTVTYDAVANKAVLTFAVDLDALPTGTGTYRLRIGSDDLLPGVPQFRPVPDDPGSSFATAMDVDPFESAIVLSAAIEPQDYPLQYPGSIKEPGHRDINEVETHFNGPADETPGITIQPYNFKSHYGWDPQGNRLLNLITEEQKTRTREIFELYGYYLGVQFVETVDEGFTIVTGDLRAISPGIVPAPGGVIGLSGDANPDPLITWPTAIMDNAELWDDKYGETQDAGRISWFDTAMHEIGHLLGYGHTYDLPPLTVMGQEPEELNLSFGEPFPEPVFPGAADIIHGRHMYRPEGNDIDVYRFTLSVPGEFSAEIIAERLPTVSQLDSVLTLYQQTPDGPQLVARNDDYFSEDAFVGLDLEAGTYFVVVTSTGNTAFDPTIENTGLNGTTDGHYDLRLDFKPREDNFLIDSTGTLLDGDADGVPGGQFNFWFRVEDSANTRYVDKAAPAGGNGSLSAPFNNLAVATTAAAALPGGGLLRVVGNGGADGNIATLGDNRAYELGLNDGRALSDGQGFRLPANVTVMIDAGAIFKMLKSNIHVGSSSVTIDRSGSALQVLGIPGQRVIFTSYDDQNIGVDTNPRQTTPDPGDWGGLIMQNDVDRTEGRFEYEKIGVYLNVVNQADLRYGGGNVLIDSVQQVVNPIHMIDARPTISYNRITFSADAAMSANPDSFEETNFSGVDSLGVDYQDTPFTPDYDRVGPDIRRNQLLNNSINGIFIRIATPAGDQLERMTVAGRWDDTDIVHVVAENLLIDGTPGGPRKDPASGELVARTDAQLAIDPGIIVKLDGARIETRVGAQLLAEGVDGYDVVFTSLLDNRYGAGGTFRTNTPASGILDAPGPGDWSGIYIAPAASGSIDHAVIAYAGGLSRVEGSFAAFNAIETHQGGLRLTNSTLENNANGRGGQSEPTREGRLRNGEGAIFVRGAQPVIVNNVAKGTRGQYAGVININVGALSNDLVMDWGRSTGSIDDFDQFIDNQGPLVRLNRLGDNSINGMVVRGETWVRTGTTLDFKGATLTSESVWDDTDIVHVVFDQMIVNNLHTFGGLRLESSPSQSLVVKFGGPDAGLKATGSPLDIDDRIGGMLHIVGQPGHPVVMTALNDDSVGAGFDPTGRPQTDTDGFRRAKAEELPGSFQIEVRYGPLMKARPQYVAAVELAVRFWERWVEDPITVVLDMEIDPAMESTGTLGATSSEVVSLDWDTVRQAMINDGRAHEVGLLNQVPLFDNTTFTLPEDPANPFSINRVMTVNRANALALGFNPATLPGPTSAYDPTLIRDGSIVYAPNPWDVAGNGQPSFFDLDRLDGLSPDFLDFTGVVVHEIGHALGFVSGVDSVDAALNDPASFRNINLQPMDMFRLEPGDGSLGFTTAARVADPARAQVFYDGGNFDPFGIDIPGLRLGDIPLSQGSDNGDGGQASHWKDLGRTLGLMDPTAPTNEAWFSEVDRVAFDYIGWDVIGDPVAGDWRGVNLEEYAHDRNVAVVTELEDPGLPDPDTNALPARAQFLGGLGRGESSSDENLRLGFVIHGVVDEPSDVDVYSFEAKAGTEIWLDIDNTSNRLDSVVELVDANATVLARSDNAYAEAQGTESRVAAPGVFVDGLQKTLFYDQDYYTTNLYDPGMRLVLPGAVGQTTTYHVRVRSSSDNLADTTAGLTFGVYELQIRMTEVDEHPGSTVQYADIRYAMDGVRIKGLPKHSPLTGEVTEDVWLNGAGQPVDNNDSLPMQITPDALLLNNSRVLVRPTVGPLEDDVTIPISYPDSFQDAQYIGNVLQSDRAAISVSGLLDDGFRIGTFGSDVVDWYLFQVRFDSIQQPGGNTAELMFDLDYADALARPDLTFAIYEANFLGTSNSSGLETQPGQLLYYGPNGGGPDDHPAPLQGSDTDDLSRGSVGALDPFIGPISLPEGYYLLQVTNNEVTPYERLQYTEKLPPNPYNRFEPVDSVYRIAEDHTAQPITDEGQGTTFLPPQVPILLNPRNAVVPYTLGDVELFVSTGTSIVSVDPFTGRREVSFGALTGIDGAAGARPTIGDFALRDNPLFDPYNLDLNAARTQRLMAFGQDLGLNLPPNDANLGSYLFIDIAEETSAERPGSALPPGSVAVRGVGAGGVLTDDTIETWGPDPESEDPTMPEAIMVDVGMFYDAIAFNSATFDVGEGYAVGRRPAQQPPGISPEVNNILIRFNAATGQAISATGDVQDETERLPVPNPIPQPPGALPVRQPNAGFDIVEQGVLDTTFPDGSDGGDITGIAFLGSRLYGVSDRGGLYEIRGYAGQGARANYITTFFDPESEDPENPTAIRFAGLASGPRDVEDRLYRNLLFAIDRGGNLYAFDTTVEDGEYVGGLQPIFVDGRQKLPTGVGGATGLDFGGLDDNLWHITQTRAGDPGHTGPASFYFGEDLNGGGGAPRYYDFLGGARGSLVTEPFSLDGYDVVHDPYLYFNYFLVTEEAFDTAGGTARDTLRVFITDDSREDLRGQWHLLASNQPGEIGTLLDVDPQDDILIDVQPLWDNSWQDIPVLTVDQNNPNLASIDYNGERDPDESDGVWRQARISLADFANRSSLRLRFDFSTAGSFDVGRTGGIELRAIDATRLLDGDTFTLNDPDLGDQVFEFDLGYTVIVRNGRSMLDGETLTFLDTDGTSFTFEMDDDTQVAPGNFPVPYASQDPGSTIADALMQAIVAAAPVGVTPYLFEDQVNLAGATGATQTLANGLVLQGEPGVADGNIPIVVDYGMKDVDVAAAMIQPLADTFAGGVTTAIKSHSSFVKIFTQSVVDQGPLGMTDALPGDRLGNFGTPLRAKNATTDYLINDDKLYVFPEADDNFSVRFEGAYIDDLIIGFATFGEKGDDFRPDVYNDQLGGLQPVAPPPGTITSGEYQIEIRRGADYAAGLAPVRTFDPRDRLSQNVSLVLPPAADLFDGETVFVSDGVRSFTFEFDEAESANGVIDGHIGIPFAIGDAPWTLVERLRDEINTLFLAGQLRVSAAGSNGAEVGSVGTTDRLDLFGTPVIAGGDLTPIVFNDAGSENRKRDQGQVLIDSNSITHSALFGVVVEDAIRDFPCNEDSFSDPSPRICFGREFDFADVVDDAQASAADYTPSFGTTRNLRELNQDELTPGIVISSNVVAFSGEGGIHYSGDPGGRIIIAPVGGPPGLAEVWDDENVHFLLRLVDLNGYGEVFEFRVAGQAPLGLSDQVIEWVTTPDCPIPAGGNIHYLPSCGPRYSPINPDMADAILQAIGQSNLDVKPYRAKGDELYLEGLALIQSTVVRGDATSVTFALDEWFYPFSMVPQQSAVPFGRIVNNTIVGLGGTLGGNNLYNDKDFKDTGILIEDHADPTLLNNVLVNLDAGIKVDSSSTSTIIGGSLYQGNTDNARNINIGDFAIELTNDDPLFVDWERGNFYPADLSRVIDSSVDSLEDRTEIVTVKEGVGIARSPILAPDFDVLGQLRIDDPRVEPPEGFGKNVFKDRGAIDRVDFLGPIAQFQNPQDNDLAGKDENDVEDQVRLQNVTLRSFVVQLVDQGEATAPTGTGIDDGLVSADSVILRRDDQVLVPGVDYRFDYQPTTNQILLTPQAGVWLAGYTYQIELINRDRFVLSTGDLVADGQTFRVTDAVGNSEAFEFESGYSLQVPQTLTLLVPAGNSGLSAVADREIFTISNGVRLVTFEFDSNNAIGPGRVRVPFQPSSTPEQVADSIVAAIELADLGLAPRNLGGGQVHVGGSFSTLIDTTVSSLQQFGRGGVFIDGQTMTLRENGTTVRYEFDDDGVVAETHRPITFSDDNTRRELAIAVREAINVAPLSFDAVLGPQGLVNLGPQFRLTIDPETSSLAVLGQPGLRTPGATAIPLVPAEGIDQRQISEFMQQAVDDSDLVDLTTLVDEAGRLVIIDADNVTGINIQFIPGIRDIAGNLLRTNQDASPFSTLLMVELPAPLDFGDAPDPYQTSLADNGARHVVVPNIRLGNTNTAELDRLSVDSGDDGVTFLNQFTPGGRTPVSIRVSTEGFIDAWVDVDGDGRFDEARDRVLQNVPVRRGSNTLRVPLPADAVLGDTWARFRFSTQGRLSATGRANDGEVEDYPISIVSVPAPVAADDDYTVDEDQPLNVGRTTGLLVNDTSPAGGDPTVQLTASLVDGPDHGTVAINPNGSFAYQPAPNFFGFDSFTYQANSEILGSNVATVTIEVLPQPDPPVAGNDQATTREDTPVTIDLVANDDDPDGALVRSSIVIVVQPAHGTVDVDDQGQALYTPAANFFGSDTFRYTIEDAEGATSNEATVSITVTGVNDVPMAVNDEIFVRQGASTTFDLLANDTDVDGTLNRQSVVITRSPKSGTIRFNPDGTIVFTPDPNFLGVDTFSYSVRDNTGATSNQAVVTVRVSGQNLAPTAGNDTASGVSGESITIDLVANDSDSDGQIVAGSVAITQQPLHGTVTKNLDGTAVYVSNPDYVGVDTFRYTVRDDLNALSNVATVTVTVREPGSPWQNKDNPVDVDDDGELSPLDALLVINEINDNGSRPLDPPPSPIGPVTPPPYLDVSGDEYLSPLDALLVINALNDQQGPLQARAAQPEADPLSGQVQVIGAALHIPPRPQPEMVQPSAVEQAFEPRSRSRALALDAPVTWLDDPTDEQDNWLATADADVDEALLDLLAADDQRLQGLRV